jgi:hypothetical protein
MVATVSTCPCTKWPPIRVEADTDRSRLTFPPSFKEPRFVLRRVSGATPTLKKEEEDGSNSVMVRQVPLTLMLAPRVASLRMALHWEMVREVPLPPEVVGSWLVRLVTAGDGCG